MKSLLNFFGFSQQPPEPPKGSATVSDNMWLVKDVIERIEKDQQDVGLFIQFIPWYATVSARQALDALKRMPPDHRVYVSTSGGTLFVGGSVDRR